MSFNFALLEPLGLFLILLSVFWRIFLAERVKDIAEGEWKLQIESKIDYIFALAAQSYREQHQDLTNIAVAFNIDSIEKSLQPAGAKTYAQTQKKSFTRITDVLFIIGSISVLSSKFYSPFPGSSPRWEPFLK